MNHVEIAVQKESVPTCTELFLGFLTLGLIGFGGVLPLARKVVVEQRQWLSPEKFTELLGLCQFLPGGNIINLSVAIGMEFRGVRGAVSSLIGLILAPTIIVVLLHYVYEQFQDNLMVKHLFEGLAAAAAGLQRGSGTTPNQRTTARSWVKPAGTARRPARCHPPALANPPARSVSPAPPAPGRLAGR